MSEYYQKLKSYMQQLFQKYFHKVKFYPSTDNFTQALLVMLVKNITSDWDTIGSVVGDMLSTRELENMAKY